MCTSAGAGADAAVCTAAAVAHPQAIAHPVVVTAVVANAGAALHGQIMGLSYFDAQKVYYSKVRCWEDVVNWCCGVMNAVK